MPYICPVVIPDHLTKFDDNLIIVGEMLENVAKFPMSQSKRLKFKIYLHDCCAHPLFLADSMQLRWYKSTQNLMTIWILHKKLQHIKGSNDLKTMISFFTAHAQKRPHFYFR